MVLVIVMLLVFFYEDKTDPFMEVSLRLEYKENKFFLEYNDFNLQDMFYEVLAGNNEAKKLDEVINAIFKTFIKRRNIMKRSDLLYLLELYERYFFLLKEKPQFLPERLSIVLPLEDDKRVYSRLIVEDGLVLPQLKKVRFFFFTDNACVLEIPELGINEKIEPGELKEVIIIPKKIGKFLGICYLEFNDKYVHFYIEVKDWEDFFVYLYIKITGICKYIVKDCIDVKKKFIHRVFYELERKLFEHKYYKMKNREFGLLLERIIDMVFKVFLKNLNKDPRKEKKRQWWTK